MEEKKEKKPMTKEKKVFIIKNVILYSVGVLALLVILFGKQIFGNGFNLFGDATGWEAVGQWFVDNANNFLKTLILLVVAIMLISLCSLLPKVVKTKNKKAKTILSICLSLLKYVLIIVFVIVLLATWGVDVATLLASLGVVALIIGLGCQSLINDLVSGIFLVIDETFAVGDIVVIDDFRGEVVSIGLKQTKIIDAGGNIKAINNSAISTSINLTNDLSTAIVYCDIDYEEDTARVEAVIAKNLDNIKKSIPHIVNGPFYQGVSSLGASGVTLRFAAKCKEEDRYQVGRDLNKAVLNLFKANDISIPFPQVVVDQRKPITKEASSKEAKVAKNFSDEQNKASKGVEENPLI